MRINYPTRATWGKKLRFELQHRNWSIEELTWRSGVEPRRIQAILSAGVSTASDRRRIAVALHLDLHDVFCPNQNAAGARHAYQLMELGR